MEGQNVLVVEDNIKLTNVRNGEIAVEVVSGVVPVRHQVDHRVAVDSWDRTPYAAGPTTRNSLTSGSAVTNYPSK